MSTSLSRIKCTPHKAQYTSNNIRAMNGQMEGKIHEGNQEIVGNSIHTEKKEMESVVGRKEPGMFFRPAFFFF